MPAGLTVQQWDDQYFPDYVNQNFFKKFMGTGQNSMIQVREDLSRKPGGSITYTLVNRLTGTAKDQNAMLEGFEEDAMLRSQEVTIREYAHAVRWKTYDEQLTAIDLRQAHKDILMTWNMELDRDLVIEALGSINGVPYATATETQKDAWLVDNADRVLFGAALSNNSTPGDHSAALANIDNTSDKLTPGALSLMKRLAKTCSPKVRPYKVKNAIEKSDAYIVFAPSLVIRDLVNDTTFVQANREARQRGVDNPLFNSADFIWDNLFIYEIEDIQVLSAVGAGSPGINVAPVYLCGAQALGQAWAKRPQTVDDTFDYGRAKGCAIKEWMKLEKLRFGSGSTDTDDPKDCGVVTGFFAAVSDS
jgi:N4-gp56 family major capsid protein